MEVYATEFGFGYSALTTQAMEHRLKIFKRELHHTLKNDKMWKLAMRHQYQRLYRDLIERKKAVKRNLHCSKCGGEGHQSNNKRCPKFMN